MSVLTTILPIKDGTSSPAVYVVQDWLTVLKLYSGKNDGTFGPKTKEAVIKFQSQPENELKVDGIVGTNTAIILENEAWSATKPILKEGSKGEWVKEFQQMYNSYFSGTLTADGTFGSKTKAEVIKFQKSRGLTADGVVGAKTWSSLRTLVNHDISEEERIASIFQGGC
jgi:peptidoglycan hydrolase-like protein with peptidoglycan-binding domain